jgi:hypothetical protein
MALALVYLPKYHTWESWKDLMVEAYAGQQLDISTSEDEWKKWAEGLIAIDIFSNEAIPNPNIYENWQDWVESVVNVINQKVN